MPTTVDQMRERWERFDVADEAQETLRDTGMQLIEAQRRQMMRGEANDGRLLPRYEDDTEFFKGNVAAIRRYESWKARITPQTPYGVMNFFQNGYTHERIRVIIQSGEVCFDAEVAWLTSIERKTQGRAFGLNDNTAEEYRMQYFNDKFVGRLKELTGAQ